MRHNVYVFLGPTLSIRDAQTILPNAVYLPPIQSGDILALLPLKPQCILIIDGYFQSTPAVWHKEILIALEQGIKVVGASSMGALRAAELYSFGMVGVGSIYQKFVTGEYEDDDEVAALHLPEEKGYGSLSEPMVNIRATLANAYESAVIEEKQAAALITIAKQLHFKERTWSTLFNAYPIAQSKQTALLACQIDRKQMDARQALEWIAEGSHTQKVSVPYIEKTKYLRNLFRGALCEPYPLYSPCLPAEFRISYFSRLLGRVWVQLIARCAKALSIVYGWQQENIEVSPENFMCAALKKAQATMLNTQALQVEMLLNTHMPETHVTSQLNLLTAWAISQIQSKLAIAQISMFESRIKKFSDEFRSLHHLLKQADFQQWLREFDFSYEQYIDAVQYGAEAQYVLAGNDDFCISMPDCHHSIFSQLLTVLELDNVIINKIQSVQSDGLPQSVTQLLLQEGISDSLFGYYLSIEQAKTK